MGIPKTTLVKAETLDMEGFDAEEIVDKTITLYYNCKKDENGER